MAGVFMSARGVAESKKAEARANAERKRQRLTHHPLRGVQCTCGPDCGMFFILDRSVDMRTVRLTRRVSSSHDDRECHHVR